MIFAVVIIGGLVGILLWQAKKIKYLKEGINELLVYIEEEEI
jgi:uncharacterized membrane protein YqiK